MKSHHSTPPDRGFTRTDLCAVLMALALLAFIALPALAKMKPHSERASCLNNLRQLGIGWHGWAKENGNKPPWHINVVDGGTRMIVTPYMHFLIISNYVASPSVMVCPSDAGKTPARDYEGGAKALRVLGNQAVGYFIGSEIAMDEPNAILAGDRNVQGSSNAVCTVSGFTATRLMQTATWQNRIHLGGSGNVLFCDGSTRRMNSNDLNQATLKNPADTNKYGCVLIP